MPDLRSFISGHGRRWSVYVVLLLLGAAAGAVAYTAQPPVSGVVGPGSITIDASLQPGETVVDLPPLGLLRADSHRGPIGFDATVDRIDLDRAGALTREADPVASLRRQVEADLRPLLWKLGRQTLLMAVLAGTGVALVLPHRRLRYAVATLAGSVGFVAVAGGMAVASFDPGAFDRPEFEGALAAAPDVLNTVQRHIDDVEVVESRLEALSDRVVGLYGSLDQPSTVPSSGTVILHVSDLHSNPVGIELVEDAAQQFGVDAIVDTGDVTSFGAAIEEVVVSQIAKIDTPYYVVPGNHDSQGMRDALAAAGIEVLDPGVVEIGDVKILGLGDPTFTADNTVPSQRYLDNVADAGEQLRALVRRQHPDLVAVHNPLQLDPSLGSYDVGIAGHRHEPDLFYRDGSVVLVAGSAGATGVGALLTEEDLPYEMELLRFDGDRLEAVDRIAFEGTDGAFRLERVLIDPDRITGYPDALVRERLFADLGRRTPPR